MKQVSCPCPSPSPGQFPFLFDLAWRLGSVCATGFQFIQLLDNTGYGRLGEPCETNSWALKPKPSGRHKTPRREQNRNVFCQNWSFDFSCSKAIQTGRGRASMASHRLNTRVAVLGVSKSKVRLNVVLGTVPSALVHSNLAYLKSRQACFFLPSQMICQ